MTSTVPADNEHLLALATPELYARNPFRVLGIRVDTLARDIQRIQQRRAMQAQLGMAEEAAPDALFPRPTDPEVERAATEALARPVDRFLAEIFWFWPAGDHDAALAALDRGDGAAALEVWREGIGADPVAVRHNRAVYQHALAVEATARSASGASGGEDADPQHALMLWYENIQDEGFWAALHARAAELDDPRLTRDFVDRIRNSLPSALLTVHATLAHDAAQEGAVDAARRGVAVLRQNAFGVSAGEDALRRALGTVRSRLQGMIADATEQWTQNPPSGFDAVVELHRRGAELLEVVDVMLGEDDPVRATLHDELAKAILQGEDKTTGATNEWARGVTLLKLARSVAIDDDILARIDNEIEQNSEAGDLANHWVAPGYWELPEDVVSALEAARERARAGDYLGALDDLLQMDPGIGYPLSRCVAYSLSRYGIDHANSARFGAPMIRDLMAKVRAMSDTERVMLAFRKPDPNLSAYANPPCLVGCGRSYSSWVNFTHEGYDLFMCSACKSDWDRQTSSALTEALEYLLLAEEVDGKDPGVRRNTKTVKQNVRELSAPIPSTDALRARLQGSLVRGHRLPDDPDFASAPCHFCHNETGDPASSLFVPMSGNVETTSFVLGTGYRYDHAVVVVPRCPTCRADHAELVHRTESWEVERAGAGAPGAFPELVTEIERTEIEHDDATREADRARTLLAEARESAEVASSGPRACDRCEDTSAWDEGLCRGCDEALYAVGPTNVLLALGLAAMASANLLFGAGSGLVGSAAEGLAGTTGASIVTANGIVGGTSVVVVLLLTGALFAGFFWRRQLEREEVRETRLAAAREAAADDLATANALVDRRAEALESAEAVLPPVGARLSAARSALEKAQEEGRASYEAEHPRPTLPDGVADEATYLDCTRIDELREKGWGFGASPQDESGAPREAPVGVVGLVSPHLDGAMEAES